MTGVRGNHDQETDQKTYISNFCSSRMTYAVAIIQPTTPWTRLPLYSEPSGTVNSLLTISLHLCQSKTFSSHAVTQLTSCSASTGTDPRAVARYSLLRTQL